MDNKLNKNKRIEDVFFAPKKKLVRLRERTWRIEFKSRDIKQFLKDNRSRFILVSVVFVFIISFFGYLLITKAEVVNFYPTSCLGGWQNPQNAQGKSDLDKNANPGEFNEGNSAVLRNVISQIFCGNFQGEMPENSQPKKVVVKFSWVIKTESEISIDAEATSTLVQIIEATSTEETAPEILPEQTEELPSASFWQKIINFAFAEETSTPETPPVVEEINTTSSLVEPLPELSLEPEPEVSTSTLEEAPAVTSTEQELTTATPSISEPEPFLEILYTLDGANWQSLAKVNLDNWQNLELEIPNFNWEDISKLQISIQSLSPVDFAPTVYLDGMRLEVEYENLPKLSTSLNDEELENIDGLPRVEVEESKIFKGPRKTFRPNEDINFEIDISEVDRLEENSTSTKPQEMPQAPLPEEEQQEEQPVSFWQKFFGIFGIIHAQSNEAKIAKIDFFGPGNEKVDIPYSLQESGGKIKVSVAKNDRAFKPGKYQLKIEILKNNKIFVSSQEFTWGVLAINTNKSIYLPNEISYLQMAVLDDGGHTICDANLKLQITNPKSQITILSTEDGAIQYSGKCGPNNITDAPDYFAYYQTNEIGAYQMKLTNLDNGYEVSDSFEVRESVPFDVERIGPTRIFPPATYEMTLKIKANQDFVGEIVETVPSSLEILNSKSEILNKFQIQNLNNPNAKEIIWQLELKKDETIELKYQFKAPDISPEFYLLGPLKFSESQNWLKKILGLDEKIIFQEARQWQLAADSPGAPQAMMVYSKATTDTYPYYRIWNGTSWGSELTATAVSANVEYLVLKFSRTRNEAILGTMDGSGNIHVQTWNGSSWGATTLMANVGTTNDAYQGFDIEYETSGDRAIIVYNNANAADPAYSIWNGSSWSATSTIDVPTTGVPYWIELAPNPLSASNDIAMILLDANVDVYGMTWNGGSWNNMGVASAWDTSASISTKKAIDVAYEQTSGESMFIWGDSVATDNYYRTWNGTTLTGPTNLDIAAQGYVSEWVGLVPNPTSGSNQLMYGAQCGTTPDLNTRLWSGSAWDTATEHPEHDTGTENAGSMNFDIVFETHSSNPNKAWLVWGDGSTASRKQWSGTGWGTATTFDDDASYVRLHANPWNGAVFAAIYQNAAGATNDDLNEYHLTGGSATWSSLAQIWAGATVADPVMFRVDMASYGTPGIGGSLGKTSDGWAGAIPVYMELYGVSSSTYPYARASTTNPVGTTFYTTMTWSAADNRFEGTIYPGSNYCNGCADPNTGTFTVTVQLDNNSDFSSIDYSASAGTFSTYITRRWNAISTAAMGNSTEFNPTWNAGGWWDYQIHDLSIGGTVGAQTNVAFAIPFHPTTANITNMAVTIAAVSVPQGTATSTTDCWWWDTATHTLYIQKASVAAATYYTVALDFDSDTDLFATRIDRVYTANMGERLFYNGLMWGNNYIGTSMFAGGHEGAGEQMELQARDFATNNDVSVDCMERVAVHVDNVIAADASAYYSADIKWKQQEWASYIISEDNNSIVTRVTSDGAANGWQQQLNNGISAQRDQTFYANKRYIKNVYKLTNNGAATRIYPLVWGREQWIGTDTSTNDEGRYDGDTVDVTPETHVAISSLTDPWMTAYDTGIFAAMGVIFKDDDRARYGYFLTLAALTNASPWAEWVNQGTEYRPDDNDAGTNAIDTFFDKNYPSVAVGASTTFTFWQWGYDTTSWANIESAISADEAEINTLATISCSTNISSTSFGTLSASSISTASPNASTTMSCSGTSSGCALYVKDAGSGSSPGLWKSVSPTKLIPSPDAAFNATSTLAAGTEGYGIQATTTAAGSGGTLTLNSRYNQTGNTVGGFLISDLTLASSTVDVTNREAVVTHKAAISNTTLSGNYNDTITYSCLTN